MLGIAATKSSSLLVSASKPVLEGPDLAISGAVASSFYGSFPSRSQARPQPPFFNGTVGNVVLSLRSTPDLDKEGHFSGVGDPGHCNQAQISLEMVKHSHEYISHVETPYIKSL